MHTDLPESAARDDQIVAQIAQHQGALYAYILSLLFRRQDALDVLQETNMVLWRKREQAPVGAEFLPWACRVASFEVLEYKRKFSRDRHFFSDSMIANLAETTVTAAVDHDARIQALQHCVQRLSERSRDLLLERYDRCQGVAEIAERSSQSVAAVAQALYRIRQRLLSCVQKAIALES
ncbi:MAG: sigma-70 family RNA polymerase sigma factor [Pirellulales bacterium]